MFFLGRNFVRSSMYTKTFQNLKYQKPKNFSKNLGFSSPVMYTCSEIPQQKVYYAGKRFAKNR